MSTLPLRVRTRLHRILPAVPLLSAGILSAELGSPGVPGQRALSVPSAHRSQYPSEAASAAPLTDRLHGIAAAGPGDWADSAKVRRTLEKAITDFQDHWRKEWEHAEMERHAVLNLSNIRGWLVTPIGPAVDSPRWLGDRAAGRVTLEMQRYLSILCFVDSPVDELIERIKADPTYSNPRTQRPVKSTGAEGPGGVSIVTPRAIVGDDNTGTVCPAWAWKGEPLPLDEGEALDLAIRPEARNALRRERGTLLDDLEAAHAQYPTDPWIAGQRVRFAIDQRPASRAIEAAAACQGAPSWCSALRGLAWAQSGDIRLADSAFRVADSLRATSTAGAAAIDTACVEREQLLLLPAGQRAELAGQDCTRVQDLVSRLWWLSDPLWSVPGNERYVAHASRRIHAELRAVQARDERYIWARTGGGSAMRELVVRYGWPSYTYWGGYAFDFELNKVRQAYVREAYPPYTAKEYSRDRVRLVPDLTVAETPFDAAPSQFEVEAPFGKDQDDWWPQEHMRLSYRLAALPVGQHALFRRDSVHLFSQAISTPLRDLDSSATGMSSVTLIGSTSPSDMRVLASVQLDTSVTLRLSAELTGVPLVLSTEVRNRSLLEPARRARFGLQPPPVLRDVAAVQLMLSDPVFLRLPDGSVLPPRDLPTVLALMAGDLSFVRTERLALYWESYGLPMNGPLQLSLRVVRSDETGVARRVGAALGVASALRDSLTLDWTDTDSREGTMIPTTSTTTIGRAIAVDFKMLPPGDYLVSIAVRDGAGRTARSTRAFSLRDP